MIPSPASIVMPVVRFSVAGAVWLMYLFDYNALCPASCVPARAGRPRYRDNAGFAPEAKTHVEPQRGRSLRAEEVAEERRRVRNHLQPGEGEEEKAVVAGDGIRPAGHRWPGRLGELATRTAGSR